MISMSFQLLWLCAVLLIGTVTAADVPFIFDENLADVFGYTPDQIEQAYAGTSDLSGVPLISAPSDDESLKIPVTGGSGGPENEIERNVGDLKRMLNSRIEPDNPAVRREAILLAGKHPGDYTIEQVSAIYSYLKGGDGLNKGWSYVRDPRGIDYFSNASEAMSAGKEIGCVGIGDCDDFAILMSALIESIGGTTRIILASNEKTGGHAYTEVYLGRMNSEDSQVEEIIKWLQQEYSTDKIYTHIDTDTSEIWLNLDWGDEKGNAHPGGPFFQGDKHIVLCLRDGYGKTPLKLPDSYSMPAPEYPAQNETAINATIYTNVTEDFYTAAENMTVNATCNETIVVPVPPLQYYATENTTINETVNVTMNVTALIGLSGQVFEECLMCNMSIGSGLANWALYLHQGYAQGDIIASAITSEYGYYYF